MSLSECKLNSLLAQQNVALAKLSAYKNAKLDAPDILVKYSEQLKREIDMVKREMIEGGLREAQK